MSNEMKLITKVNAFSSSLSLGPWSFGATKSVNTSHVIEDQQRRKKMLASFSDDEDFTFINTCQNSKIDRE